MQMNASLDYDYELQKMNYKKCIKIRISVKKKIW